MDKDKQPQKRLLHYDLLRIFACFSVIMLHSASQFWYELPMDSRNWLVANSYDALFRFGVPVFVMISGALFLAPEREVGIKRLYTHNILRLAAAYLFWSALYGLWDSRTFQLSEAGIKPVLLEMMAGRYHLWFVPMLIGIYMLLPILRTWVAHAGKEGVQYFLGLFLVFQILRETLLCFIDSVNVKAFLTLLPVELVGSYVGYFVLGYYIAHYGIGKKYHKWIYLLGVSGVTLAVVFGNMLSLRAGEPNSAVFDSYSLFTFLPVAAIFLFFQEKISSIRFPGRIEGAIKEVSACTFGIYLLHILVIETLQSRGFHSMSVTILAGIPLLAAVCFLLCLACIMVLRRVPFIGKYIC